MSCHECHIFQGKKKTFTISLTAHFSHSSLPAMGLDFIGKIHHSSSAQHKWILTATDYFTKWIEAIPTKQATNNVIIQFIESNILSRFGCPQKIITDNVFAFKSKKMVELCEKILYCIGEFYCLAPTREWFGRIFQQIFDQHHQEIFRSQ